jgi:hypothetical protein
MGTVPSCVQQDMLAAGDLFTGMMARGGTAVGASSVATATQHQELTTTTKLVHFLSLWCSAARHGRTIWPTIMLLAPRAHNDDGIYGSQGLAGMFTLYHTPNFVNWFR